MIIFLYGPDTFRSRQKLNEIVDSYKKIHKSGLNFKIFDLKEKDFQEIKDEMRSVSMFDEKKLAIFKNASSNKNFQSQFLKEVKYFIGSKNVFVFFEESVLGKSKFFDVLKEKSKAQEFKFLTGSRLKTWVKEEIESYKAKINNDALDQLVEFVGNDLWQMQNEIKKLVNYKEKGVISTEDIELLIKPKIEADIFEMIDALVARNRKRALELSHKHLEKGDSPLYLLSMIIFQMRNLLIIKDLVEKGKPFYSFARITKLHPFVIRKSYSQAQKFGLPELKKIYQKIFRIDLDIKTGKLDSEVALDLLISGI